MKVAAKVTVAEKHSQRRSQSQSIVLVWIWFAMVTDRLHRGEWKRARKASDILLRQGKNLGCSPKPSTAEHGG